MLVACELLYCVYLTLTLLGECVHTAGERGEESARSQEDRRRTGTNRDQGSRNSTVRKYRVAQRSCTSSCHHIDANLQDKIKQISPHCF